VVIGVNSPQPIPLKNPSDFQNAKTFDHRIYLTALRSFVLRQATGQLFGQEFRDEVFQRNPQRTYWRLMV